MAQRSRARRKSHGPYNITQVGNSKAVAFVKALESSDFPSELGDQVVVEEVHDGDGVHIEIHPHE